MMKRVLCILLVAGAFFVGAISVLLIGVVILNSHAPAGPAQAKGLPGHYYNLVYTLAPCSSTSPEKYEDANISFQYLPVKDAPRMERHYGSMGPEQKPISETILHYKQFPSNTYGNIYLDMYKPINRKPAGIDDLKVFVKKYAEDGIGPNPEITNDLIPGAPFAIHFKSGPREGACFTDMHNGLYCFKNQDMAMRRGDFPFLRTAWCSLGLIGCSLDDYESYGIKAWFIWPYEEKRSECNFMEINRTIRVKGKQ